MSDGRDFALEFKPGMLGRQFGSLGEFALPE